MARYPKAIWKPLPENQTQNHITPNKVILHSAVSGARSLWGYFSNPAVVVESHFYVDQDGNVEQYMDTNVRADADYAANQSAIAIETWDGGHPDTTPWNDKQVAALTELMTWLCMVHNIPPVSVPTWSGAGIGYHSQFSRWNTNLHSCPGRPRIAQIPAMIAAVAKAVDPHNVKPTPPPAPKTYVIPAGGTLWKAMVSLGVAGLVSVGTFAAYNHIPDPAHVTPGITVSAPPVSPTAAASPKATPTPTVKPIVKPTPTPTPTPTKVPVKPVLKPRFPGRSVLRLNARNSSVRAYEKCLVTRGYLAPRWADGYYGTKTVTATMRFQRANASLRRDADGYPGPLTWAILFRGC